MKRLLWVVLCAMSFAQNPSNSNVVVVGNPAQPVQPVHQKSIQDAITAAGPTGTVIIPADWALGETYNNTSGTLVIDLRGGTLTVNGVPFGNSSLSDPLNVKNLNVSATTNVNGFNSSGPGNWQNGFPAYGAPFDPFCAYLVPTGMWQLCVFPDPNNGSGVLAFNDGVGIPNVNKYPMMTGTLSSFQGQGVFPCWDVPSQAFSFSIPCKFLTNVVMNTGSNGSGVTIGQESSISVTDPGNSGLIGPNIYGNLVRTDVGPNAHISTVGGYRAQLPQFEAGSVTTVYYAFSLNPATPVGTVTNSAAFFTGGPAPLQYGLVAAGLNEAIIANDITPSRSGICHAQFGVDLPITALHDCWLSGTGSPNGVLTANVGSIYSRQDGGLGTSVYVKETGSGNTGWDAVQPIILTAPTISSGFGVGAAISSGTSPAAFRINVGTGGAATTGVIGLPSNTNGWNCSVTGDLTTLSSTVFLTKQTASSSTTAAIGNFNTAGAPAAWTASDILAVNCSPVL